MGPRHIIGWCLADLMTFVISWMKQMDIIISIKAMR